jgi:acyl CoA:acetate/3-ketoacid CoA transferase alpha subunit
MDKDTAYKARDLIEAFEAPKGYKLDKVCDLEAALREHVKPGMMLHFGYNQARAMALSNALTRVFAGTNPGFTIVAAGLVSNQAAMFSQGLIKKLIVSFVGENYPAPSPNRIMQNAINSGKVEIENQSLLVVAQRLAAGAYGFPFALTRSLAGSSMEDAISFLEIDDPFGSGERIGAVSALVPDITFVHALAADRQGNLLIAPPLGDGVIQGFAASRGVIATAERIVDCDTIRKFSHLTMVPANRVLSVSSTPMGCHPYGLYGPPGLDVGYVEDYLFFRELQKTTKSPEAFETWSQEWILGVENQDAYVAKLGVDRIKMLRGGAASEAWQIDVEPAMIEAAKSPEVDGADRMVVAAAHVLRRRAIEKNYGTIGSGVGYANLAAWLAASQLQSEDGLPVELLAEIGLYGFYPKPGEPFIFSNRNIPTCKSLTTAETVLGLHVSGRHNQCIAIIGAAQIDVTGNINSTYGSDGRFLVGSGGANDIASAASELIAVAQQSSSKLVERVPYITSVGTRVSTLVTNLGVFEKREGRLILTRYFEQDGKCVDEILDQIRKECGWSLEVANELSAEEAPLPEELFRIRLYDPRREFLTSAR